MGERIVRESSLKNDSEISTVLGVDNNRRKARLVLDRFRKTGRADAGTFFEASDEIRSIGSSTEAHRTISPWEEPVTNPERHTRSERLD